VSWPFEPGQTSLRGTPTKLMDLPPAGMHWARNLALSGWKSALHFGRFGLQHRRRRHRGRARSCLDFRI
jgi:hypothetical protein